MCKHVAAVLYGIGARLDKQPELLFRLRELDEKELITKAGAVLPLAKKGAVAGKILRRDDLSELFGLDMAQSSMPNAKLPDTTSAKSKRAKKARRSRSL
jgi:uncharacterized Zn finger protein